MFTLPHHVEFLSDEWLVEANQIFNQTLKQFGDLKGHPFSLSECFIDAPPHLNLDGAEASWQLSFDGSSCQISRGFNSAADLQVTGGYQAGVTLAQAIGMTSGSVMQHTWRELRHTFGADALTIKGKLSDRAQQFVSTCHDQLGRKTVENPDIHHRAKALGLERHIREVEEQGYTVIEQAISSDFADELREATLNALLPHNNHQLQWMLYHGVPFERIVQNPQLMTLIDASLGRGAVIASISSICKGPGAGTIPLHTDYSHVPEPYPEFAMTGVGVWALEDWTVASGPTWIAPGTHKLRRGPKRGEQAEGIAIEMPKGSVVYFTHGVWHWQGDRTEPGDRVTLHSHFNRGILRGLEPKKIDVQMLHRNPPRLGEMLGEDDWFDKLKANGRDYIRAGYMTKLQSFTDKGLQQVLADTA